MAPYILRCVSRRSKTYSVWTPFETENMPLAVVESVLGGRLITLLPDLNRRLAHRVILLLQGGDLRPHLSALF